jgi:hypothetical protein
MLDEQAAYFVGQALGHLAVGQQQQPPPQQPQQQPPQQPQQRGMGGMQRMHRQMTPQQAVERAGRSVGRAFQLYLRAGLTKEQAVQRIVALAQTFGSLE